MVASTYRYRYRTWGCSACALTPKSPAGSLAQIVISRTDVHFCDGDYNDAEEIETDFEENLFRRGRIPYRLPHALRALFGLFYCRTLQEVRKPHRWL